MIPNGRSGWSLPARDKKKNGIFAASTVPRIANAAKSHAGHRG
jgi:hypothetical protein